MKQLMIVVLMAMLGLATQTSNAQGVSISESDTTAATSSILDVTSTTKGVLVPRLTTTQQNNIESPATGLVVYNTTESNFFFYNGSAWEEVGIGKSSSTAELELESTTKGFLPPRMTTTQRDAISSPDTGLVIYNTTTNKLQCYNGTSWNDLF